MVVNEHMCTRVCVRQERKREIERMLDNLETKAVYQNAL